MCRRAKMTGLGNMKKVVSHSDREYARIGKTVQNRGRR